jgi:hypothetical protein
MRGVGLVRGSQARCPLADVREPVGLARTLVVVHRVGSGGPMYTLLVLSAPTLAAPAGYDVSSTTDGCTFYTGPKSAAGTTPLLAECTWPDVTLEQLDAHFSKWESHDEVFSAIASSQVQKTEGGTAYVHQVHVAKGISERECVLKMTKSTAGGLKFAWTLDPSFTTPAEGRVLVEKDDGYWQFTAAPSGGVQVTYALDYGPGGSVPYLLVRWFQGSGFTAAITELHDWIRAR